MASYSEPICTTCLRLDEAEEPKCEAFPDGIPDAIWLEAFDHRQPYRGDHGLRYEGATNTPPALDPDRLVAR